MFTLLKHITPIDGSVAKVRWVVALSFIHWRAELLNRITCLSLSRLNWHSPSSGHLPWLHALCISKRQARYCEQNWQVEEERDLKNVMNTPYESTCLLFPLGYDSLSAFAYNETERRDCCKRDFRVAENLQPWAMRKCSIGSLHWPWMKTLHGQPSVCNVPAHSLPSLVARPRLSACQSRHGCRWHSEATHRCTGGVIWHRGERRGRTSLPLLTYRCRCSTNLNSIYFVQHPEK